MYGEGNAFAQKQTQFITVKISTYGLCNRIVGSTFDEKNYSQGKIGSKIHQHNTKLIAYPVLNRKI